jgi:hypothetical protein
MHATIGKRPAQLFKSDEHHQLSANLPGSRSRPDIIIAMFDEDMELLLHRRDDVITLLHPVSKLPEQRGEQRNYRLKASL